MASCTFFGHRDTPNAIEPILRLALIRLIEYENVDSFYVGNQGGFDCLVARVLNEIKDNYPYIRYAVVLAYMPQKGEDMLREYPTILADGCENVPPKFAIDRRNHWMLQKCTYVVTYVTHTWGGAAKFKKKALKAEKIVLELSSGNSNSCIAEEQKKHG